MELERLGEHDLAPAVLRVRQRGADSGARYAHEQPAHVVVLGEGRAALAESLADLDVVTA